MSAVRESTIEKAVCDYARANGCIVLKLGSPGQRGQPDRAVFRNGKTILLEFKRPGGKVTSLQYRFLRMFRDNGFFARWTDNIEEGKRWIREQLL